MEIYRRTSYINLGVFSLRILFSEQSRRAFDPLRIMDNITFYEPPLASKSQPPCFLGVVTASKHLEALLHVFVTIKPPYSLSNRTGS